MRSKKIFLTIATVAILVVGVFGASAVVHAQSRGTMFSGLAQMLASKFNLNQSDVQSAISTYMQQQRQNWQQNRQQQLKNRLDQEVTAGKITADQETAIIAELATLKGKYNLGVPGTQTLTQRQQAMQGF